MTDMTKVPLNGDREPSQSSGAVATTPIDRAVVDVRSIAPVLEEEARLHSLHALEPYVREHDAIMANLARQAAAACRVPMALVSLMEEYEQRIVGAYGLDLTRVARCDTICATTILQPDVLVVEDASHDPRFESLPGVYGVPYVRFYAGAPVFDAEGMPLGTVCAIDTQPRELSSRALHALQRLAVLTTTVLKARQLFDSVRQSPGSLDELTADAQMDALLLTLVEGRSASD